MPASKSAVSAPSNTCRVTTALSERDDFMSLDDLTIATGLTRREVRGAIHWLRKIKAIDSVESAGHLYWFLTADTDQRTHTIDEKKKEDEPRIFNGRKTTKRAPRVNF